MYFDRILFSAVFITLLATVVLAVAPAFVPASIAGPATIIADAPTPALERVVVVGKRDDARS